MRCVCELQQTQIWIGYLCVTPRPSVYVIVMLAKFEIKLSLSGGQGAVRLRHSKHSKASGHLRRAATDAYGRILGAAGRGLRRKRSRFLLAFSEAVLVPESGVPQ